MSETDFSEPPLNDDPWERITSDQYMERYNQGPVLYHNTETTVFITSRTEVVDPDTHVYQVYLMREDGIYYRANLHVDLPTQQPMGLMAMEATEPTSVVMPFDRNAI